MARIRKEPGTGGDLREEIQTLTREVHALREEVEVLRICIDEFREDLIHSLRTRSEPLPPLLHIHSLPLDPSAPDFDERINAVSPEQIEQLRAEAVQSASANVRPSGGRQTRLFS